MTASVVYRTLTADEVGSPYVLAALSLPTRQARSSTSPLIAGGSRFTGNNVGDGGQVAFEIHILGSTTDNCADLDEAWSGSWDIESNELDELVVTIGSQVRCYRGRPASYTPILDGTNTGAGRCTFTAIDPFWLAPTTSTTGPVIAGATTGGLDTPVVTPIVTAASGATGDATIVSYGTRPAPWYVDIVGPVTNPRLILGGRSINIIGDVPSGSVLHVDSETQLMELNGQMRPWDSTTSEWWDVPVGVSTFSFRADLGAGTAQLSWRDAYR